MNVPIQRCLRLFPLLAVIVALAGLAAPARAAVDQARVKAFLEVTGFDVALESIKLSAGSAPEMLGIDARAFGSEWTRLVNEVFDPEIMHGMAVEILSQTLDEEMLEHAMGFYGSDLGARLVAAENASHMADSETKSEQGDMLVAAMVSAAAPRLEIIKRLNGAIGSEDAAVRAIQEVQVRFLMAAAAAGVIELQMEEPDLREAMREGEPALRLSLQTGGLSNAAYTYQSFSDEEVAAYAEALEQPLMREVYELMNAVQFEIMANRFEATAARLTKMRPSQEL
ncbi:DUF2059 domain-containing protein [Sulfitobacter sp. LCG007]